MLAQDALEHGRIAAPIPDPVGIDDGDRSVLADAQAVGPWSGRRLRRRDRARGALRLRYSHATSDRVRSEHFGSVWSQHRKRWRRSRGIPSDLTFSATPSGSCSSSVLLDRSASWFRCGPAEDGCAGRQRLYLAAMCPRGSTAMLLFAPGSHAGDPAAEHRTGGASARARPRGNRSDRGRLPSGAGTITAPSCSSPPFNSAT